MKKTIVFMAMTAFVVFAWQWPVPAQDWSLPQDNKPKKKITWATPAEITLDLDYPFEGVIERYHYKEMREEARGSYTLRVPNKFKGSGLTNRFQTATWAIGEPDPSAGYRETRVSWVSDWQKSLDCALYMRAL